MNKIKEKVIWSFSYQALGLEVRNLFFSKFAKTEIRKPKSEIRAFTLIELMVVMFVLGIVVTVVSIRMGSNVSFMKLDAATCQIREHIRLAREYSKMTQDNYYVSFNTSNNTYGIYKSSDDSAVAEPLSGRNMVYNLDTDDELKSGNISEVNFDGESIVEFDARGRPLSGKGGSQLSSTGTVTITYGSESATINVQPITGHVSIQ